MRQHFLSWLIIGGLIAMSLLLFLWELPLMYLQGLIGGNVPLSSIVFVSLFVLATVVAPVVAMPIIPSTALLLGPFLTALLSIIGWTIGGVIAFLIARHAGRPLLKRFVSLEELQKYEHLIPENTQFLTIVLLRMLVPVDVLSYLLGLTITMTVWKYTLATAIGVSWFSFALAYMGAAFFAQNTTLLLILGATTFTVFILGWYIIKIKNKKVSKSQNSK